MTCREKLAIEHPEHLDPDRIGGCYGCPHQYLYASKPDWCAIDDNICRRCWDREAVGPDGESKRKVTKVKLFARVTIPTLETVVNEFIVDKEIIDIKFQVAAFAGNPMGSAMIMYREVE